MASFFGGRVKEEKTPSVIMDLMEAGNRQRKKMVLRHYGLYVEAQFPSEVVYHTLVTPLRELDFFAPQVQALKDFLTGKIGRWMGIKECRVEIHVQHPSFYAEAKQGDPLGELVARHGSMLGFYVPPRVAVRGLTWLGWA